MSLKKLIKKRRRPAYTNKLTYEELVNAESSLWRTLFGPIPEGHQREFFESRKNVWIWYEGFVNNLGKWQELVVRYEVRPAGVYKRAGTGNYERIMGEELRNFRLATKNYLELVKSKLYC